MSGKTTTTNNKQKENKKGKAKITKKKFQTKKFNPPKAELTRLTFKQTKQQQQTENRFIIKMMK